MDDSQLTRRLDSVRRFNRYYTQKIGVLHEGLLDSPFSLTEVRVLYELDHREQPVASELGKDLGLDPGYLSRMLGKFKAKGLLERKPSVQDGRQSILCLTEQGKAAFAPLNERARDEIRILLSRPGEGDQIRLVEAMECIRELLSLPSKREVPYLLRPHQPGDMSWVVYRHGVIYSREYGWDETFEALVASIVAGFIQEFDPKKERCWIAEVDGEIEVRAFSSKCRRRRRSCDCCWWSQRLVDSALAGDWSTSASALPHRPVIKRWYCGPIMSCSPRATSTNRPVSNSSTKSRIAVSVTTWSVRPCNGSYDRGKGKTP